MILAAHQLRIVLPAGWSGRLFARAGGVATLHAANFALPLDDGEFGDRSTGVMPSGGAFAALTEYLPGRTLKPSAGLFASASMSLPLDPARFSRARLAHARPGQVGMQHFFTGAARPFCLYVVVSGSPPARRRQVAHLSHVLRSVQIRPRGSAGQV